MALKLAVVNSKISHWFKARLGVAAGMILYDKDNPVVKMWDDAAPGVPHRKNRNKNRSRQQKLDRARNRQ